MSNFNAVLHLSVSPHGSRMRSSAHSYRRLGLALLLVGTITVLHPQPSEAQYVDITGSTNIPIPGAGHDYAGDLNETVDPANGMPSIRIKVPLPSSRGFTLPFYFAYDANGIFQIESHFLFNYGWADYGATGSNMMYASNGPYSSGGWSYTFPQSFAPGSITYPYVLPSGYSGDGEQSDNPPSCHYDVKYAFTDPRGGRHMMGLFHNDEDAFAPYPCRQWQSIYNAGDIQLRAAIGGAADSGNLVVIDADGTTYRTYGGTINTAIEDRNGNIATLSYSGTSDASPSGPVQLIDTSGRTALSASGFGRIGTFAPTQTVSISGADQPYTLTWSSIPAHFTPTLTIFNLPPNLGCGLIGIDENIEAISALQLPNGTEFDFSYASNGLVNKIVYPSGGYVRYEWMENLKSAFVDLDAFGDGYNNLAGPLECQTYMGKPAIQHRYVSFDGVHEVLREDYSYTTTWGGGIAVVAKSTTVISNDLLRGTSRETDYVYTPCLTGSPQDPQIVSDPSLDMYVLCEKSIAYKDGSSNVLKTVNKTWANVEQMNSEQTVLENGSSSLVTYRYGLTETQYFFGDPVQTTYLSDPAPGGQLLEKDEWDYTQPQSGQPTRKTVYTYQVFPSTPQIGFSQPTMLDKPCRIVVETGSSQTVAETDFLYDGGTTVCGTSSGQAVTGVSNLPTGTHDDLGYGTAAVSRGNLTTKIDKCFFASGQSCADRTTQYTYDQTGQVISSTDPNGNATQYSYSDNFSGTGGPSTNTNSYLTKVTRPSTNASHISTAKYDYASGRVVSETDENLQTSSFQYADAAGRLTEADLPDGGKTTYSYSDTTPNPSVTTVRALNSTQSMSSTVVMDGMWKTIQTQHSDPAGTVFVDTVYDGEALPWTISNPYRISSDGSTTYTYDALGRKSSVTNPDATTDSWAYTGSSTTFTDETASNAWTHATDALGRLTQVVEPGALSTVYSYDLLNNLTSVNQLGAPTETARARSFSYDSLSRLHWANNPETGVVCYGTGDGTQAGCQANGYDANGNLLYKTDARPVATSYTYDALNRLVAKVASDGSMNDTYQYDGCVCENSIGRLAGSASFGTFPANAGQFLFISSMPGATGGTGYIYDAMGRPTTEVIFSPTQSGLGNQVNFNAGYDLAGHIASLSYPDGLTIQQTWNTAGQLTGVGNTATGETYLASATYTPSGAVSTQNYGNGVAETFSYNNRLQECEHTVAYLLNNNAQFAYDKQYLFGSGQQACAASPGNNGNIMSIPDVLNTGMTQTFTYDSLNRLSSAIRTDQGYNYSYPIDSFGNMQQVNNGFGYHPTVSFNSNNRLQISGYLYDASGNLTSTGTAVDGGRQYAYTAESRIAQVDGGETAFYYYDPDGNRNLKLTQGATFASETEYWNGLPLAQVEGNVTDLVTEDLNSPLPVPYSDFIYANGHKIATVQASTDNYIDVTGNAGGGGYQQWYGVSLAPLIPFTGALPYVVTTGDTVAWRQWQSATASGGVAIQASGHGSGCAQAAQALVDQDGGAAAADTVSGSWHSRVVSLAGLNGCQLTSIVLGLNAGTQGAGSFADFADLVFLSPGNAAIAPIYNGQGTIGLTGLSGNNLPQGTASFSTTPAPDGSTTAATHYYTGDNLGTAQLEFAGGGWPIWMGQFVPFGAELDTGVTINNFKFTGKERDAESGLDYFGARYYASSMGRWISPDWADKPEAVPYSQLDNPQSLNLYGYVNNNPLSKADPDGHDPDCTCPPSLGALIYGAAVHYVDTHRLITGAEVRADLNSLGNSVSNAVHAVAAAVGATTEQGRDGAGKFVPKEGGEAAPGAAAEAAGLAAAGAAKNASEKLNGTIRDGTGDGTGMAAAGQHVEVKSGATISNTQQLAKMGQAAVDATGKALLVVTTNPNVKVTRQVKDNPNLDVKPHQ